MAAKTAYYAVGVNCAEGSCTGKLSFSISRAVNVILDTSRKINGTGLGSWHPAARVLNLQMAIASKVSTSDTHAVMKGTIIPARAGTPFY